MAALFNFPNYQQDLPQLDKVPFEDIWLGTIQVSQRDLTGALPVINIFEKLLPCETCVFCQTYTLEACGIYSAKTNTSFSRLRACSHEPRTVNYPGVMIAPGQELPRIHMMICCPGAMLPQVNFIAPG